MVQVRQTVRTTAGKVPRSEELLTGEKEAAAGILHANPALGDPHVVRCGWCGETRIFFRDETDGPLRLTARGWCCDTCNTAAASQEVRF